MGVGDRWVWAGVLKGLGGGGSHGLTCLGEVGESAVGGWMCASMAFTVHQGLERPDMHQVARRLRQATIPVKRARTLPMHRYDGRDLAAGCEHARLLQQQQLEALRGQLGKLSLQLRLEKQAHAATCEFLQQQCGRLSEQAVGWSQRVGQDGQQREDELAVGGLPACLCSQAVLLVCQPRVGLVLVCRDDFALGWHTLCSWRCRWHCHLDNGMGVGGAAPASHGPLLAAPTNARLI